MTTITNAVPKTVLLGIQDLSTRTVPNAPEQLPTHLPKIYIFAEEGPATPQLVVGDSRTLMYGANSFDALSDYYNHATVLANAVNAKGNAAMIQRVIPEDAAPPATIRIWMDVLQTTIKNWQRNTDGSFKTDADGNRIQVVGEGATIPGFKIKFVKEQVSLLEDGTDGFGKAETKVGDQVDEANSTQSTRTRSLTRVSRPSARRATTRVCVCMPRPSTMRTRSTSASSRTKRPTCTRVRC